MRERLKQKDIIVVPGASSALFARVVEDAGFEAVYATGAGISNMQFGFPDFGLLTMTEVLETVKRINDATSLPVIADIDNGYGNAINVYRTVMEFSKASVAAVQIEDQEAPKRCGHFEGKTLITCREMENKIKAARDGSIDDDLVIIARTDAVAVEGIEEALERANAYVEAGADMIFVEALRSKEELSRIPPALKVPAVANMVEGGKTPLISAKELEAMGYKMVLYANCTLRAAVKAVFNILADLKNNGSTKESLSRIISMKERNAITRLDDFYEMERRYGIKE
ncbi:MAG: hypothetical protein PWQ68_1137 [Thermoanaerobacteraceae bacterium]|nr:hypothetical protein [Thermoanaerobacteraceae bacterium]